jgi:hypothetical protein
MGEVIYIPSEHNQCRTDRLFLDNPLEAFLCFPWYCLKCFFSNAKQVVCTLLHRLNLLDAVRNRSAHLLGELAAELLFAILDKCQSFRDYGFPFCQRLSPPFGESIFRCFGDIFNFFEGRALTLEDDFASRRRDCADDFAWHLYWFYERYKIKVIELDSQTPK